MFTSGVLAKLTAPIDACPWGTVAGRHAPPGRAPPAALHAGGEACAAMLPPGRWCRACWRRCSSWSSWSASAWCCTSSRPATATAVATASVVVKTLVLYAIMITGSIWEKVVFGRWLFARAFFWEDVFSMLVLGLHTAYLGLLLAGTGDAQGLMFLALAAYAAYVVNATQFVMKLRAARRDERGWRGARPARWAIPSEQPRSPQPVARRRRAARSPGAARTWPARGLLRPHRHHLAAPQDPGRLLPRRRLAHLRAPDPVRGRRDDLRRAALRHRHHRRARPGRAGRCERGAGPRGGAAAGAAPRHPAALPRRLLPVRGHQARPVARRAAADRAASAARAGAELLRQRHRDDLHPGRGCLPRLAGAGDAGRGDHRAGAAGRGRAGRGGRGPDAPAVHGARHRPGRLPAAAPGARAARGRAPTPACCWRSPSWPTPPARWKPAAPRICPRPSRSAPRAPPAGCAPRPRPGAWMRRASAR